MTAAGGARRPARRRAACATLLAAAVGLAAAPAGKPVEISGWGGLSLSETVTSLWLKGPRTGDRADPVVLVFFRGASGWHRRKWGIETHFGTTPAWIRLTSPDLTLSVECDRPFHAVVQDRPVDLKKANVYLVSPVEDGGAGPVVEALGLFRLAAAGHAHTMPPQELLDRHPELKRTVLEEENPADP